MARHDEGEDAAARTVKLLLDRMPLKARVAVRNDLGERGEIGNVDKAIRRAEELERNSARNGNP